MQIAENYKLNKIFDAILLDEAQDYTPDEIRLFTRLAERLFCVADERQKIYQGDQSIDTITKLIGSPYELRFHYRNGVKICRVADEIAKRWHGYQPLRETSNYDERTNPSTVDCFQRGTIKEQVELIMERLTTQRVAFPEELIGILCPTVDSMNRVWEIISRSAHSDVSFLLHGSVRDVFPVNKQVIVSTFHAAKGLEFRALHLVGCDELRSFGNNRRMAFTAVTRAKTALSVYHNAKIHPYFDAAIRSLEPALRKPSMNEIFGGTR
jgi:superfamily I DNA/RNA helicase